MKKKLSLSIPLFIVGIFVVAYVVYAAGKESYRGRKIEKEIELLRQESQQIRAENKELYEKISYFDTDEFREKVAKEKLNLKKEDEKVVEMRPVTSSVENIGNKENYVERNTEKAPEIKNYKKWWNKFFSLQE